ncbi:tegument protein U67 [Elephant endotheliotropic herpesvirus 3A]|uniref:Tegument protein U67 n=1 Tax=Elephant endotheliotropic herpesvirus 3A TaxID=1329409 RepID=A0A866VST6_9BETA|nr:tegument protein U67 [Elephant endotheliotropic herpesvirus 3A]QOE74456.1 tegument protein U67 [Elephant endotheliotropic herpesvirus 3A]
MDWLCTLEEDWKDDMFREAVRESIHICNALSPTERFQFIETPHRSFLLVTNILPDDHAVGTREEGAGNAVASDKVMVPGDVVDVPLERVPSEATETAVVTAAASGPGTGAAAPATIARRPSATGSNHNYMIFNSRHITRHKTLFTNPYILYTKEDIQTSLSFNKSAFISKILTRCNVPGVLDHNNVIPVDILMWLLFAGPMSCCSRRHCFGYTKPEVGKPFPVLLPPVLYQNVTDVKTFVNIAEMYVYAWYSEHKLETFGTSFFRDEDIDATITELRGKYKRKHLPLWHVDSRICLFCALYLQNRLCLENNKEDVSKIPLCPIVIQDCVFNVTSIECQPAVAIGHIVPGSDVTTLFPVYQLDKLLSFITIREDGTCVLSGSRQ